MKTIIIVCLLSTTIISKQLHTSEVNNKSEVELKTLHANFSNPTPINSKNELIDFLQERYQPNSQSNNFSYLMDVTPGVITSFTFPPESEEDAAIYTLALASVKKEDRTGWDTIVNNLTCQIIKNNISNAIDTHYMNCSKSDPTSIIQALIERIKELEKENEEVRNLCPDDCGSDDESCNWRSLLCCNQCH